MADSLTKAQRSAHMAKIRSKRTKPEMDLHGHLKGNHVRHTMWPNWFGGQSGSPDISIGEKTLVFVHGCFWHGCPKHFRCPKTNSLFWSGKITRNRRRHENIARHLRASGYRVVVIWEHDLSKARIEKVVSALVKRHG